MMKSIFSAFPLALLLTSFPAAHAAKPKEASAATAAKPAVDPALFSGLKWREIGPFRGGRVATVTGLPGDRNTYYFGGTGGGGWETAGGGRAREEDSGGFFGRAVGARARPAGGPHPGFPGGGGGAG